MLYEVTADLGRTEDVDLDGDGIAETRRPEIKIMTVEAATGDEAAAIAMTMGAKFVRGVAPAKVQPVVSVKDFGAVGDGVTDDTAAVQAAIDTAIPVVVPPGDYKLSAPLRPIPANAALDLLARADGMHHKTLAAAAAKILGDATPSTKAEIIAALHAVAA